MFRPVSPHVSFPKLEEELLRFWEEGRIFQKSVEGREDRPRFVFYEGPPTANGLPHPGHVLTRVIKDVFLRYRTMCGYCVPRRGGWDTHGLPVEVEVEKQLGISGRLAIEQYGVEAFTRRCVESVFRYIEEWRRMTQRIGFWVDLDRAYVTFHRSYVESVWWALASLFQRGLLYQDYKVVWWWPQGGTALSAGEVGQGYRTVDDPSVFVRFPVLGEPKTAFLAWTTTPWTLPSNVALAVHPDTDYVTVSMEDGERLIVAAPLAASVLRDRKYSIVETRAGRTLRGMRYQPLFEFEKPENGDSYLVVEADFVTLESGTGIVHIAPAFGEDDFRVAKEKGLGFLQLLLPDGTFPPEAADFAGLFCKEADRLIIRQLRERGLLLHEETYRHDYPFCWRKDSDPLIQYARRSWFIRTTAEIQHIIANNQEIHWEPEHIKEGRFGSFLRSNIDWALSRERFWGTPLPIWINDETGRQEVIASVHEIIERNPQAFAAFEQAREHDPALSEDLLVHKPWIDEVTWQRPGEPGTYRRVPEVIDCWFDSGCMPFAQWGFPHTHQTAFHQSFPADFITEALDQTRGWFYSLLTISTLLFPEQKPPHPFRNCVVLGLISDEKGRKLSKSKRNYTDPMDLMAKHGADAVRWALYTGTVPGQNTRFSEQGSVDAVRDFLLKVWNAYSFFVTYAGIDHWDPGLPRPSLAERTELDRWVLAELDSTIGEVRGALDQYKSHIAARRLEAFVDALSNWYIRRTRARFWSSESSVDKAAAFATLYEVLVELAHLVAPFVPFVAESLYQNLVRDTGSSVPESVHLAPYPSTDDSRKADDLRDAVGLVRTAVNLGQRVRMDNKLKVRQPLSEAIVVVADDVSRQSIERFEDAIREELNVHALSVTRDAGTYVDFIVVPNFRLLGPRLGSDMPACKKALNEGNGPSVYEELQNTGEIKIKLPDRICVLQREEVEIRLRAKENFAAAADTGIVVVLDTRVTEALRLEGLARETVNRLQRARKAMDLSYDTRIEIVYEASGELGAAIDLHQNEIAKEVLAITFQPVRQLPPEGERHETDVEGASLVFWIAPR